MFNKELRSIQDPVHKRILNPIFPNDIDKSRNWLVDADVRKIDESWVDTHGNHTISQKLMQAKYPFEPFPWTEEKINNAPKSTKCKNYITYPYFEESIYNLKEKNYLV